MKESHDVYAFYGGKFVFAMVVVGVLSASGVGALRLYNGSRSKVDLDAKKIQQLRSGKEAYGTVAQKSFSESVELQVTGKVDDDLDIFGGQEQFNAVDFFKKEGEFPEETDADIEGKAEADNRTLAQKLKKPGAK